MIGELRAVLRDEQRLTALVSTMLAPAALSIELRSRLAQSAAQVASELASDDPAMVRTSLLRLVGRVELAASAVLIVLNGSCLAAEIGTTTGSGTDEEVTLRIAVAITLRRRGVETKLILTRDDRATAKPDETMLRALARARLWMNELIDGTHRNVSALATAYGTNPHYVARHLPLACLAPSIVEAILSGRQLLLPEGGGVRELTTWDLLNRIDVPLDWEQQKRTFQLRG